jgi:hypothetical protein
MLQLRRLIRPILLAIFMSAIIGSAALALQDSTPIVAGETYTGTLSDDASAFNYDLPASDTPLLLTATSSTFTPTLGMGYASGIGGSISVSFDGDVGNPLFVPPLAEGQDVQVQVTSTSFPAEGDFTLTAVAIEAVLVTLGETVEGAIGADGTPQYFSFPAEAGKLVTVTAQGGEFDTRLQLFVPGSVRRVAEDNDGGVGYDPEIYRTVLAGGGTGYIEVASALAGESGSFRLSVTVSDPPTLGANTPSSIRLGGSRGMAALTYAVTAGQTTQVTVNSVGGETDGAVIRVYQDGALLASENRFDAEDGATLSVTSPSDSLVYVIITADTTFGEADEGQFAVSLSA